MSKLSNPSIVTALAVAVCREIYILLRGEVQIWQAVHEVQERLNLSQPETQKALEYAVAKGWVLSTGPPRVSVMLLAPGRALFAKHPIQPVVPR
jgi:hypothetical protein